MGSATNQPSEELVQLVGIGASYGIEWSLQGNGRLAYKNAYNPQWRMKAVKEKGLPGLYTSESDVYSFAPGEGLVGAAFAKKEPIFVKDVQESLRIEAASNAVATGDTTSFHRLELAKKFGIHSVYFMPCNNGVIEIGTTETFNVPGDMMDGRTPSPNKAEADNLMPKVPPSNQLRALVENSPHSGVCYGIQWEISKSGCLVYRSHYNPSWRIEAIRAAGLKSLYTTRSKNFVFGPGYGYVGKAFAQQQIVFVGDVGDITMDTVADADQQEFARIDLAKEFGIQSVVFLPVADGVLEIGSTNVAASIGDLVWEQWTNRAVLDSLTDSAV